MQTTGGSRPPPGGGQARGPRTPAMTSRSAPGPDRRLRAAMLSLACTQRDINQLRERLAKQEAKRTALLATIAELEASRER